MIHELSKYLAHKLSLATGYIEEEDHLRYGLELFIGYLLKVALLLGIAIALDIVKLTIALVVPFVIMRIFTGGTHLTTYSGCLIFSLFLFLLLAWVASIVQIDAQFILALIASFIINLYIVITHVPASSRNPEKKNMLKRQALLILAVIYLIIIASLYIGADKQVLLAALFGLHLQLHSITPIGVRIIECFNRLIRRKEEQRI